MSRTLYRITQGNLIENSVQECLPYILNSDGPYYYFSSLSYPKDHVFTSRPTCIRHIVMLLSFQNFLYSSLWPRDLWLLPWPCHLMWLMCDSVIVMLPFFFLNQQFITQSAMADCGSYFVTMYRWMELTWRKRKEKEEKSERRKWEKQMKRENMKSDIN